MKEEASPLRSVSDKKRESQKVIITPRMITEVKMSAACIELQKPPAVPIKNMEIIAIKVGKRPLQGTRLLVRMAISRSLGESMIRHPTTPAALQPNPMAMVKACFPQVLAFLN